jgi:ABC-type nitrate/sulfonate/bicarbonate transport system permease component
MIKLSKPLKILAIASISFLMWESAALVVRSAGFPHSWGVANEVFALGKTFSFWSDFAITLWITLFGFSIGTIIAILLGLVMGLNKNIEISSRGTLNFMRVIPSVVLLPLLIASIGSSLRTAVILTAYVVSSTFVLYVIRGIADTDLKLIETSELMQLPKITRVFLLYLPSTVALLGTGMRLCASRAFGTVVTAGIVAGTPGLGARLYMAQTNSEIEEVFAYVFVMGVTGVCIYSAFTYLENRLFKWKVLV